MAGYGAFANYYDALTGNISYPSRAARFHALMERYGGGLENGILLDLACGTGSLSMELAALGYDVIGVDGSPEMLSAAMQKLEEGATNPLFLCQEMSRLDLFGTIGYAICALDSLNHLRGEKALGKVFSRVSLFLEEGGLFLFDVNTPYKHREVLGENVFIYETEEVYCVWQNHYHPTEERVEISLDFFVPGEENGLYRRERETFSEWAYPEETLERLLAAAGLTVLARFEEDSDAPPKASSQRILYVARKTGKNER